MTGLDWAIVIVSVFALTWFSLRTVKYMQGVADFLSANRSAGRYVLTMASGATGIGAISVVGYFEQYYAAGLPTIWWQWIAIPASIIITLTGWVFYRFRETRCLTLAQFFEVRYSRGFRIYAALIVWFGGILNFGIFPYVASNFFVYFCGLPETVFTIGEFPVPTYWPIMVLTTGLALAYTTIGGHITVMITDCLQGIFVSAGLMILSIFLLCQFSWSDVSDAMQRAPARAAIEALTNAAITDEKLADRLVAGEADRLRYRWEDDLEQKLPEQLQEIADGAAVARDAVVLAQEQLDAAEAALAKYEVAGTEPPPGAVRDVWRAKASLEDANLTLAHESAEADRRLQEHELIVLLHQLEVDEPFLVDRSQDESGVLAAFVDRVQRQLSDNSGRPAFRGEVERKLRAVQAQGLRASAELSRRKADSDDIIQAESLGQSMLNPFDTAKVKDFSIWFFLIMVFNIFYGMLSWQGSQAYQSSGISPHEQKMGQIIAPWIQSIRFAGIVMLSMGALVFLEHPDFAARSAEAHAVLDQLRTGDAPQLAVQQRVPIALTHLLPTGLRGFFCVMMIFLLITTQDTYMHSWGSIFIQDVVMPLRRRPLTPAQHVNWLRGSIIFVAVFAIVFAALYQPNEYIQMYFAITGSITAGLGCAIIGGLYWRYGGTLAAYVAMALGAILSVGRIVVHQYKVEIAAIPDKGLLLQFLNWQNGINSQWIWFFIMLICIVSYIVLSLLARREPFDLERMLHRGKYDIRQEHKSAADAIRSSWLKVVGITEEFTRVDRLLALALVLWNGFWVFVFVVAAIYNFTVQRISIEWWVWFWIVWIWIQVVAGVIATVWFSIGGVLDIRSVLHRLSTLQRDERDDGTIVGRHMAADEGTIVAEGNDAEADEEDGG